MKRMDLETLCRQKNYIIKYFEQFSKDVSDIQTFFLMSVISNTKTHNLASRNTREFKNFTATKVGVEI